MTDIYTRAVSMPAPAVMLVELHAAARGVPFDVALSEMVEAGFKALAPPLTPKLAGDVMFSMFQEIQAAGR